MIIENKMNYMKMMEHMATMDLPDMEPLLIWQGGRSLDKMIWVHPYIDTWFAMGEDGCDQDMHIITFDCGDDTFSVAVKSDWIESKFEKYFSTVDWEHDKKPDIYGKEYVDTNKIFDYLLVLLEEDTYVPLPLTDEPLNTIKQICKFREKYSNGQFCFSEAGEWVSEALSSCVGASFTSDCGFHYDESTNTWGYDT